MNKDNHKTKDLAHFTNDFALNAQIGFSTARQMLLFLALISQTNPKDKEKMGGIISMDDIIRLTRVEDAKRSGSVYVEVLDFIKDMQKSNYVEFQTEIVWRGQTLPKYITIFDVLEPIKLPSGTIFYKYEFSERMRPHIKGFLQDFVQLTLPRGMKSGHAIRFLIMAKSHHDRLKAYKKTTQLRLDIEVLKRILGLEGKYKVFKDFRRWVIEPIVAEVNDSGLLDVSNYEFIKTGRRITHVEFFFQNGGMTTTKISDVATTTALPVPKTTASFGNRDFVPEGSDIDQLSRSQVIAYEYLIERNCKEGIVYRQIIQKVPSSEYIGWEDVFVQKAWERFEKVTKYTQAPAKAGAFIKWWVNGEFKNRLFPEIMEEVIREKKTKGARELFNRELAKTMTNKEFVQRLGEQKRNPK